MKNDKRTHHRGKLVIPSQSDFCLQPSIINRAAWNLSVTQRRVVYLAMARCKVDDPKHMNVEMRVSDVVKALDMGDGGNQKEVIKNAFMDIMSEVIKIELDDGSWDIINWFARARYIAKEDKIHIRLSEDLQGYITEYQKSYACMLIDNISKIESKYALHIYDYVMGLSGFEGKNGNPKGCWYAELDVPKIRFLFSIGNEKYKGRMNNFKRFVIDEPTEEINSLDLGIKITTSKILEGKKKIIGFRFDVKKIKIENKKSSPKKKTPKNPTLDLQTECLDWALNYVNNNPIEADLDQVVKFQRVQKLAEEEYKKRSSK
jgi:plasmid replication initiation protein